ncbi:MAG TPA: hypothetical protein VIZ43_16225 [Trebonia sp.]
MPGYVGRWLEVDRLHFAFERCAAGSNIDHLIAIFPNAACPVSHWGYIYSGKVRVEYVDQPEEIFSAGDLFFVPPGHRPYMLEDTELLQVTDKDDFKAFMRQCGEAGLVPLP